MRTLKINILVLYILGVIFLGYALLTGIPWWVGLLMSFIMIVPAIISQNAVKNRKLIQYNNSYDYLKDFREWLKQQMKLGILVSRFIYPTAIVTANLIIWYSEGRVRLMEKMMAKYPDMILIGSVPLYYLLAITAVCLLMIVFAPWIYRLDVGMFYGRQAGRLKEIIADLEALRK